MRKRLLAFLFVLCLGGFGGSVAFGQTGQYIGASIGAPLLQGYYGLEDAFAPDVDARIRLALGVFGGFAVNVGADALFNLSDLDNAGLATLYAGVGPSLGFGYGGASVDATGLIGVNYALDPGISLFGETGLGVGVSSFGAYIPFRLALGVNFNLR
jgi:hypothetical protein